MVQQSLDNLHTAADHSQAIETISTECMRTESHLAEKAPGKLTASTNTCPHTILRKSESFQRNLVSAKRLQHPGVMFWFFSPLGDRLIRPPRHPPYAPASSPCQPHPGTYPPPSCGLSWSCSGSAGGPASASAPSSAGLGPPCARPPAKPQPKPQKY